MLIVIFLEKIQQSGGVSDEYSGNCFPPTTQLVLIRKSWGHSCSFSQIIVGCSPLNPTLFYRAIHRRRPDKKMTYGWASVFVGGVDIWRTSLSAGTFPLNFQGRRRKTSTPLFVNISVVAGFHATNVGRTLSNKLFAYRSLHFHQMDIR